MSKQDDLNGQEPELPEVQQELSQVATNPKRNVLLLIGVCAVFGYFAVNILFSNSAPKEVKPVVPVNIVKPVETNVSEIPTIPQLPEPPKLVEPTAPPPPENEVVANPAPLPPPLPIAEETPALPTAPVLSRDLAIKGAEGEEANKRKEAKRKSSIILVAGKAETKTPEQIEQEASFKFRGNTDLVLGRGKIVDAVLESAMSTDFGGEIRAIVSRDVFSESGKVILIPKGAKVFGTYSTGINGAYGYVSVEWTRVDLASGYSLNFQGTGVDNLGKKGYEGRVDTKFKEKFTNSILTSVFKVASAQAIDRLVKPVDSTQTSAQNTATSANIRNIALAIFNDTSQQPSTKIANICSSVQNAITDKTSTAYTNFQTACLSLQTNATGANDAQKLTSLISSVNSAADSLIQVAVNSTTPTKAQDAAKKGFEDITKTVTDTLDQEQYKPTITINQGTPIKIYVNKDYTFPKAALSKLRVVQ